MTFTDSILVFTCVSTHAGAPRWFTRPSRPSLTGCVAKLGVHQTVESFAAAHPTGRHACGINHASLLLLSGARGKAAEATMCLAVPLWHQPR